MKKMQLRTKKLIITSTTTSFFTKLLYAPGPAPDAMTIPIDQTLADSETLIPDVYRHHPLRLTGFAYGRKTEHFELYYEGN